MAGRDLILESSTATIYSGEAILVGQLKRLIH
jgi:hypothetical protein